MLDANGEAGGSLRYGMPAYGGQADAIAKEVAMLRDKGVEFVFGKDVGIDISLAELKAQGIEIIDTPQGAKWRKV